VTAMEPEAPREGDHYTVDEVAAAAGVTVRTLRFYASKGLLPAPELRGRVGFYDEAHLARLRLIHDLQEAGFTLSAIERFVARMPQNATAEDVEVFHALLTPWVATVPEELSREQLDAAAGRRVDDELLDGLVAVGVAQRTGDGLVRARPADLALGLELLDLGVPRAMITESRAMIDAATGQLAEDLSALLRRHLLRPYLEGELPADQRHQLSGVIERLKPLTIQAVMQAMHDAVDRAVRARAGGAHDDPT
jgi:DNA-binding transcriptional MerR regulator